MFTRALEVLQTIGWVFSLLLTLVILPYLRRLVRLHNEQNAMIRRKLFEHTGVLLFGVFDGRLQSDYLGGFLTTLFGERLFHLIVGWNDRPSPGLILPRNDYEAEHLTEILAAHASPYVLQSNRIDAYFDDVEIAGGPSYAYTHMVVGLARPDQEKLKSHDYPRVVIINLRALRQLMDDPTIQPQWDTPEGRVWLATLRELGEAYVAGKPGIAVLEFPVPRTVPSRPGRSRPDLAA